MKLQTFSLPDAEIILYYEVFNKNEMDLLFAELLNETLWQQGQIKIFAKVVNEPRCSAWYSDIGIKYSYSGKQLASNNWTNTLLTIKEKIEPVCQTKFNGVLVNLYRSGQDSMGWHSDNEAVLGRNPIIASVSFGASRTFQLKHIKLPSLRQNIELTSGSLLVMKGTTQHFWKHQIPKTNKPLTGRINLTFRTIL